MSGSRLFILSFLDSVLTVNNHRECVRKTSFEKMLQNALVSVSNTLLELSTYDHRR